MLPAKPTNLQEVNEFLETIYLKTKPGELINNQQKNIVIFSCHTNDKKQMTQRI